MLLQLVTLSALVVIVRTEQGSCPPTLAVDLRDANCGPDKPCNNSQICCPTWHGGAMCVDPVTRRHFTTLVKRGRCPDNPRGTWICADSCTGDSDCPRTLKCCRNRCGALACQKPDSEPDTTVPTPTTLAPVVPDTHQPTPDIVPNSEGPRSNGDRPRFNPMEPFFPSVPTYNPSGTSTNNRVPATFPANSLPFPSEPFPMTPGSYPAMPGSYPVGPFSYPTASTYNRGFFTFYFPVPTSSSGTPAVPDLSENNRDTSASQPRSNNRISWPDGNNILG